MTHRKHYVKIQRTNEKRQILIGIPQHLHYIFDGADEAEIEVDGLKIKISPSI